MLFPIILGASTLSFFLGVRVFRVPLRPVDAAVCERMQKRAARSRFETRIIEAALHWLLCSFRACVSRLAHLKKSRAQGYQSE